MRLIQYMKYWNKLFIQGRKEEKRGTLNPRVRWTRQRTGQLTSFKGTCVPSTRFSHPIFVNTYLNNLIFEFCFLPILFLSLFSRTTLFLKITSSFKTKPYIYLISKKMFEDFLIQFYYIIWDLKYLILVIQLFKIIILILYHLGKIPLGSWLFFGYFIWTH